jgi:hypothetical protein
MGDGTSSFAFDPSSKVNGAGKWYWRGLCKIGLCVEVNCPIGGLPTRQSSGRAKLTSTGRTFVPEYTASFHTKGRQQRAESKLPESQQFQCIDPGI